MSDVKMNKQLTKESLIHHYHTYNKTQQECADFFKYSQPYIFKCMKKWNILARPKFNEQHRRRIANFRIGKSSGMKGRVCPIEQKNKISETLRRKYANNELVSPMKGKRHTEEAKRLIREKRATQIITDEAREKLRYAAIANIEKYKYNGGKIQIRLGKYEKQILDNLEICFNYKILRQYEVVGFFLDGYCPLLNLAIEIDEPFHKKEKQSINDVYREERIKEKLGCQFLRLNVGDNNGK